MSHLTEFTAGICFMIFLALFIVGGSAIIPYQPSAHNEEDWLTQIAERRP